MFTLGTKLCRRSTLSCFFRYSSFRPVTHVIFDLDGTILDSESIYEVIYNKVLSKYGKELNQEVRSAIMGTNEQDACRKMVDMLQLPVTPQQYWKQVEELYKVHLVNAHIKPGADRLIRHLSQNKVPLAIATSGSEKAFKLKSSGKLDLFAHFHHIVHGSSDPEVIKGKPAPDIFLVAARRFPPPPPSPDKCLVFEDAPNGLRGATAAGMQVVMVPEHKWTGEQTKGATLILKSLEEFVPEAFGLPAYTNKGSSTLHSAKATKSSENNVH